MHIALNETPIDSLARVLLKLKDDRPGTPILRLTPEGLVEEPQCDFFAVMRPPE